MRRIALNGFGRIGRAILRINEEQRRFAIVAINDVNPETNNMAYLLQYDSTYGRFEQDVSVDSDTLYVNGQPIRVFHDSSMRDLPWESLNVDLVIEATGVHDNVLAAPELIARGVKKVIITHSPDEVDHTVVLGANEETYDPGRHHVISSSICDAVAVAPVLKLVDDAFGIESGFLTTLHPWLAYQNLLDGPSVSWALPGKLYYHYAIGRASPGALIPKPTSAVEATERVLPHLRGVMRCMSFRIPVPVVGVANLYLRLNRRVTVKAIEDVFQKAEETQRWPIIRNNDEPLVSVDFTKTEYSAIVDHRWTDLAGEQHLYLVLWYDNEWAYSNRVLDIADYVLCGEQT